MDEKFASRRRSIFSMGLLARLGLTAAFFVWFYLIWNSTAELERQLSANTDQFAVVHNLQVEYKVEVQEWKNLLLRSNNRDSLDKYWRIYGTQYRKVDDAAKAGLGRSDVRSINVKLQAFIEDHEANLLQYKKSAELLAQQDFDVHKADANVQGIDRPLLEILEAADAGMQQEKENINGRLIANARNRVEKSLMALALLALVVIWWPKS
ncbi:MAG: hypothetical protein Q8O64_16225 [Sideroxyarcus sp.]|nr:hypothetical protein [Sideroxyarcus sp.]